MNIFINFSLVHVEWCAHINFEFAIITTLDILSDQVFNAEFIILVGVSVICQNKTMFQFLYRVHCVYISFDTGVYLLTPDFMLFSPSLFSLVWLYGYVKRSFTDILT